MSAELNVSLRLLLDGLQQQSAAAATVIKQQIDGAFSKSAKTSEKIWNFKIVDAWGKAVVKSANDGTKAMKWFEDAVKRASFNKDTFIKGLKEPGGKELSKVFGLPDINDIKDKVKEIDPVLAAWRKENAGGIAPGMKISGIESSGSGIDPKEIFQKAVEEFGGASVSSPVLPEDKKIQEEEKAKSEKEKAINREADLTRIADARQRDELRVEQDKLKFTKDMSLLMLPLTKPGSIWATAFSSRAISQGLLGTETGRNAMAKFGLSGASGASIATTALVGGATVAGAALAILRKSVDAMISSIDNARKFYSKSLTSGLGTNLTIQRGLLARVLGVSEDDVLKFGGAIAYINPKIEQAKNVLQKTAMPLAKVGIDFEVLKIKGEALAANLMDKATPGIERLIDALGKMFDWLSDHAEQIAGFFGFAKETGAEAKMRASTSFWAANPEIKEAVRRNLGATSNEFRRQGGQFTEEQWKRFSTLSAKGALTMGKSMGLSDIQAQMFSKFVQDMKKTYSGDTEKSLPAPTSFMKQLPTSSWEKMGLVIGGRGNTTNDLIRQGNKHLATIAAAVSGNGYVPRSFGMNPSIAQP
jgi:hypothetical protein